MKAYKTTVRKYYKWGDPNVTLVGSPTVSNGVVSGFSTAKYATVFNIPSANSIELGGKFSYTTSITGISCIFDISTTSYTGFNIAVQNNRIRLWTNSQTVSSAIEVGVTYWFRCECNSSGSILYLSTDGKNYTKKLTLTNNEFSSWTGSLFSLGVRYHNKTEPFTGGSIYLEDCYMKINNSRVWTGLKIIESTSSNYDFSEDVDVCKLPTGFNRKYYKYTYKNWTQPKLTTNGTIGGSSFAVTQSNLYNAEYAYCAFDANESTQWTNNGNTGYLVFYNPMPLNVTKISVMNGFDSSYTRPISSGTLLASNDGNSYKTIKTFTNSNKTAKGVWNIDASSNTGYYKYYKLNVTGDGSYARITTLTVTAKERSIVEGTESDYVFFKDKYTSFGITE